MTTQADTSGDQTRRVPWRSWAAFMLGAVILYAGLYAWSEWLVYRHAEHNRFFAIRTAPPQDFDFVVLGASHAMPLAYGDANWQLEQAIGASVMNLSSEGAGVLPNRMILDYFLSRHSAKHVLYIVDAFVFYDRQWNEDRLDASMLNRAPLDATLAAVLWSYPWARDLLPVYLSGFGKINNADRFAPDISEGATKFDDVYHPIAQIDRQRIRFLFPGEADGAVVDRYVSDFEALAAMIEDEGMNLIVIRPPTPPRYRDNLPDISDFLAAMARLADSGTIDYHDLSETVTDDPYFYDTDHLNRDGVATFINDHIASILSAKMGE